MSDILEQEQIVKITGYRRQQCQEEALRDLGYIVLGRNAKNEVRALAAHPLDPSLRGQQPRASKATLNTDR